MEQRREDIQFLSEARLGQGRTLAAYQHQMVLQIKQLLIRFQLIIANHQFDANDSLAMVMQEFYQLTRMSLNCVPILDAIFEFRECVERNLSYIECPIALYTLFKFYQHEDDFLIGRSTTDYGFRALVQAFDHGSKKAGKELIQYLLTGEYFSLDRVWIRWMLEEIRQEKNYLFSQEHPTYHDFQTGVQLLRTIEALSVHAECDLVIDELPEPDTEPYQTLLERIRYNLTQVSRQNIASEVKPKILQLHYRLECILAAKVSFTGDALKFVVDDYFTSSLFDITSCLNDFEAKLLDSIQDITDIDGLIWFYQGFKQKESCLTESFIVLERLIELNCEWAREEIARVTARVLLGSPRV